MNQRSKSVKLFCLPYAGGVASSIYNRWKGMLAEDIILSPVELAGRGKRLKEPMYTDFDEAVEDIFNRLRPEIASGEPYMFFGHSMGSMLAYAVAQRIKESGLPAPLHVFFSGKGALHIERPDKIKYHLLGDTEFRERVLVLGGTPPQLFNHPELLLLFLPLLKNDFKLADSYQVNEEIKPFDYDITVLMGKEDVQSEAQRTDWQLHTTANCRLLEFDGGHFFINQHWKEIAEIIGSIAANNGHQLDSFSK